MTFIIFILIKYGQNRLQKLKLLKTGVVIGTKIRKYIFLVIETGG